MTPFEGYLTTAEVADRLGVTEAWVTRLARQGRFEKSGNVKAVQVAGVWLIPLAAVEHYEATRRPPGNPDWSDRDG